MKILFMSLFCFSAAWAGILPNIQGKTLPQEKIFTWNWPDAKKGTVIVFLSAVCPCSNGHISHLKKLKEEFPDYHFVGIHSNADEDHSTSSQYFKEISLNFDVIQDEKSLYANLFGAYKTPHSFLVSREGKILYQGGVTSSSRAERAEEFYLKEAIKNHQSGKAISLTETRVLGCEISRN